MSKQENSAEADCKNPHKQLSTVALAQKHLTLPLLLGSGSLDVFLSAGSAASTYKVVHLC